MSTKKTEAQPISFDADAHEYRMDGVVIPSVTHIIKESIGIAWEADEWYLQRGTAIHACAAFMARGIDFDVPEGIEGEIDALRSVWATYKPSPVYVEHIVYSRLFRYAGTLDLGTDDGLIIDYKHSMDLERARLQLAGYAAALCEMGDRRKWRGMAVELRDDGTFRASDTWVLDKWRSEFLACRTVCGIKERL